MRAQALTFSAQRRSAELGALRGVDSALRLRSARSMEGPGGFQIVWIVASRTPWWVYALLAFLLYLGLRRLKPKTNRLWVAALAPGGFLLWSAAAALALARGELAGPVAATWGMGFVMGAASAPFRLVPRPEQVSRGVFLFAASWVPLIAYMLIFWTRYGLEVWAAFVPRLDSELAFAGLALSAVTAGRTFGDFLPLVRRTLTPRGVSGGATEEEGRVQTG